MGNAAGAAVLGGSDNTLIGAGADPSTGLTNATAIGARARVDTSNALVLGSINGVNGATSNTNVGIGTTTPSARLAIQTESPGISAAITHFSGSGGVAVTPPTLMFRKARGTVLAPAAVSIGDLLGLISAAGHDGVFFSSHQLTIRSEATENWLAGAHGTRLIFQTTPNGSTTLATVMALNHDGNVGIGTALPQDRLQVLGDLRVGTVAGTGAGSGCVRRFDAVTTLAGTCASDARFKRDVTPFAPSLDRIAALRPAHYFWRADEFPERGFGRGQGYGLIAQEVETVLPELVSTDAQGYKAVDYSKLPLLAIQAIRELKEQHDELRAAYAALEQRLAAVERLLAEARSR